MLAQPTRRNAVRSIHQRCSIEKGVLRPQACNFIKKRLWQSCFLVSFATLLKLSFSQNTSGRLPLCRVIQVMKDKGFVNKLFILLCYININVSWLNSEPAKWRACVLACFACFTYLTCSLVRLLYVLACLACLHAWRASWNGVLGVLQKIGVLDALHRMTWLTRFKKWLAWRALYNRMLVVLQKIACLTCF